MKPLPVNSSPPTILNIHIHLLSPNVWQVVKFKFCCSNQKEVSPHYSLSSLIDCHDLLRLPATHHVPAKKRFAKKITFCGAKYSSVVEDAPWMSFWMPFSAICPKQCLGRIFFCFCPPGFSLCRISSNYLRNGQPISFWTDLNFNQNLPCSVLRKVKWNIDSISVLQLKSKPNWISETISQCEEICGIFLALKATAEILFKVPAIFRFIELKEKWKFVNLHPQ